MRARVLRRILVIVAAVVVLHALPAQGASCPRPKPDVVCQAIGCPVLPGHAYPFRRIR